MLIIYFKFPLIKANASSISLIAGKSPYTKSENTPVYVASREARQFPNSENIGAPTSGWSKQSERSKKPAFSSSIHRSQSGLKSALATKARYSSCLNIGSSKEFVGENIVDYRI